MPKTATLYRMVLPDHICPYGLKTRDLLRRKGYIIDDHRLTTRADTDAFKAEQGVTTTPQVFIDGKRIGGYDDTRRYLGVAVPDPKALTYTPVLVVFAVAALMALAASFSAFGTVLTARAAEYFLVQAAPANPDNMRNRIEISRVLARPRLTPGRAEL